MGMKSYSQSLVDRISVFLDQFVEKEQQFTADQQGGGLYTEIHRLEKRLSRTPTRPFPISSHLEAITEQQKIMDMSG